MEELIVARAKSAFLSDPPKFRRNGGVDERLALGDYDGVFRLGAAILRDDASSNRQKFEARLALATVSRHQGNAEAARIHREGAVELADASGSDQVRVISAAAWEQLKAGRWEDGSFHESVATFERAERLAAELDDERARLSSLLGRTDALTKLGRDEEALLAVDGGLARALELRFHTPIPGLLTVRGVALSNLEHWEHAMATLDAAVILAQIGSLVEWEIRARFALGGLLSGHGEPGDWEFLDRALAVLAVGEKLSLTTRSWSVLAGIRGAMARSCERLGNLSRAAVYREAESEALSQQQPRRPLTAVPTPNVEPSVEEKIVTEGLRVLKEIDVDLHIVLRRSPEGEDLQILHRNAAARRQAEFEGNLLTLLSEVEQSPTLAGFGQVLRGAASGTPGEDEVEIATPQGTRRFRRRAVPSEDGAVMLLRDVTPIQDKTEKAVSQSEFLERLSHDIRTPLNGVLGLANLLERSDLDARQRIWIEGLLASGDLLNRVISDVADISKIEAGKLELSEEPFAVATVVREAAAHYEPAARDKGLALWIDIDPALNSPVKGDSNRLRQVLGNLMGNAVRFTQDGEVRVSARQSPKGVRFEITDTGVGISADRQKSIFDDYGLLDGEAGLGLPLSRRLVELMGGEIHVRSREGEGTVFTFEVPLAPSAPASTGTAGDKVELGLRVLLVEDNDVSALVATGHLERVGCRVTRARDGEESLRLMAEGGQWDVVLMDIRLPGMSGLQTARQLRRLSGLEHLPIVALTAGALRDEKEACFEAGMDAYLSKPFRPRDLTDTLRRFSKN